MSSRTRHRLPGRFLAGATAAALGLAASLFVLAGPAQAADTVKAQLSLSGIATSDNPTGGSTVGLHPGDTITISPSTVPTQGLQKLGLSDLLGSLLGGIAGYQVVVDFSGLPGGAKDTTLKTGQSKSFTFPKAGTYSFTWSAKRVTLLGIVPIDLDGNQLAKAGVELNAKNQYVGKIVVATDPPKGGISIQLPSTSVQPKVGSVSLPKVSLPGVTTPTIPTSVPSLNTGSSSSSGGSTSSGGKSGSSGDKSTTVELPVPALVVPQGSGQVIGSTSGYGTDGTSSGSTSNSSTGFTDSTFGTPATSSTATKSAASSSTPAARSVAEPAASRPAATSGMPVVLAVVAVIALVLVAGTYARLFLLGRGSSAS